MRYRVVVGDRYTVRGVVELEATCYELTELGALIIKVAQDDGLLPIVTYGPGMWRSITCADLWEGAFKRGTSDENSRRREAPRSVPAV